jgi:hypothetical protein
LKFLELETQAPKQETKLELIIRQLGAESAGPRYYNGNNNKKQLRTASNNQK